MRMVEDLERFRERVRRFLGVHATPVAAASTEDPRGDRGLDRALAFQQTVHAAALAG